MMSFLKPNHMPLQHLTMMTRAGCLRKTESPAKLSVLVGGEGIVWPLVGRA